MVNSFLGFPGGSDGKESACHAGDTGPILGWKDPWRRAWHPTPVLLPGEFHGQGSLAGYSPWGRKESDTTERLITHSTPPKSSGLRHLVTLEQCRDFLISLFFLRDC